MAVSLAFTAVHCINIGSPLSAKIQRALYECWSIHYKSFVKYVCILGGVETSFAHCPPCLEVKKLIDETNNIIIKVILIHR